MSSNTANAPAGTPAVDVVGFYTSNFVQVFSGARPMKATAKPRLTPMKHPIETGATITDHVIYEPTELDFSIIIQSEDYQNTYQRIKQLYLNATLLIVTTKADTFTNQLITELPHEETAEFFDAIVMELRLQEVLFATSRFTVIPRNPTKASTVNRGNQQTTPATPAQTTEISALLEIKRVF
jgi:hypothetical protein